MIEGRSPEEIRAAFNLPDDLSEEQKLEPVRNSSSDPRLRLLNRLYAKKRKVGGRLEVVEVLLLLLLLLCVQCSCVCAGPSCCQVLWCAVPGPRPCPASWTHGAPQRQALCSMCLSV
jgi:hypothetical protein